MPTFLRFSVGFYLLATALGLALRVFFVAPFQGLVFQNALHAHSHTLYFGWGALGIFALAFEHLGAVGNGARLLLWGIVGISAATFVSFWLGGYWAPSIVISSLSLLIWGAAVTIFWRHAKGKRGIDVSFLRAGIVYLVLASSGAVVRTILIAVQGSALSKSLAIFAFLHNFAWFFVFSVIGILLSQAKALGVRFDERLFRWQLVLAIPLAWITFPLGVAGGVTGALGWAARFAGIGLLIPAAFGALGLWRAAATATRAEVRGPLRWLAGWLLLEAALSAAGGFGLAASAVHSRHLAILYLHVLLVGVVSFGLMLAVTTRLGVWSALSPWLHNVGLAVMTIGLALGGSGGVGLTLPSSWPFYGLVLAVVGGALIFAAGLWWAVAIAKAARASAVEARGHAASTEMAQGA